MAPPGRQSILECTAEEVRRLLDARYRRAWGVSEFDRVQREWPCYMIPDDHELIDNWGATPEHSSSTWGAYGEGAFAACHDYEMSRVLDHPRPPFYYGFDYGPVAVFTMDLRSEKRTRDGTTQIYSETQLGATYSSAAS